MDTPHQYLIDLLDELEAAEPHSDEHKKLNVRINQYFTTQSVVGTVPIPNKLLLRAFWLGLRKDGVLTSLWAMRKAPRMVVQEIKSW